MLHRCRLCSSTKIEPVPFDVPADHGRWFRCSECGSDSAAHDYDPVLYASQAEYMHRYDKDLPALREDCRVNCDWFDKFHQPWLPKTFLDVGCCHGAGLDVMAEKGWAVHGFDVSPPPYTGPHVAVANLFTRWLFPQRYAAVMCREVIEHVDNPRMLLNELAGATEPEGLVQVQTPRPFFGHLPQLYSTQHLFLASVNQLELMLGEAGLVVLDRWVWEIGQAFLCRKPVV